MFYKHFSTLKWYLKVLWPVKEYANYRSDAEILGFEQWLVCLFEPMTNLGIKSFPHVKATPFFHSFPLRFSGDISVCIPTLWLDSVMPKVKQRNHVSDGLLPIARENSELLSLLPNALLKTHAWSYNLHDTLMMLQVLWNHSRKLIFSFKNDIKTLSREENVLIIHPRKRRKQYLPWTLCTRSVNLELNSS